MRTPQFRLARLSLVAIVALVGACTESKTAGDAAADGSSVTPSYIGGPCAVPADCVVDAALDPNATPWCNPAASGYCTLSGCAEPGFTCPGTSRCFPSRVGVSGFCLNLCVDEADCRPGFECFESVTGMHACRAIPEDAGIDGG